MDSITTLFNKGFGNCIFMSRDVQNVETTLMSKMLEFQFMPETPTSVKVTPVDNLQDKLLLSFDDGSKVEGVLSWAKSSVGAHYVLKSFKETI